METETEIRARQLQEQIALNRSFRASEVAKTADVPLGHEAAGDTSEMARARAKRERFENFRQAANEMTARHRAELEALAE